MTRWLITGAAGFIGFHLSAQALADGIEVLGVDDCNAYYDPRLKRARLAALTGPGFRFVEDDIARDGALADLVARERPDRVVHLAAQAGVRHALHDPRSYARSNLLGFVEVAEACVRGEVEHLVYASSSSVYGETSRTPFSVHAPADHPVSLYAATKRANELLAHTYSHVHGLPTTGLRFFTVYGPWGRPDMAYYRFAQAIEADEPIRVYGDGSALRDFTYVDDIVAAVRRVTDLVPAGDPAWTSDRADPATSRDPFRLYNIGRGDQHPLSEMIELLEQAMGRTARRVHEPVQPGDVRETHAEVTDLEAAIDFRPRVSLADGLSRFVEWFASRPGAPRHRAVPLSPPTAAAGPPGAPG